MITKKSLRLQLLGLYILFNVVGLWSWFTSTAFQDLTGNQLSFSLVFVAGAMGYVVLRVASWLANLALVLICWVSGISPEEVAQALKN